MLLVLVLLLLGLLTSSASSPAVIAVVIVLGSAARVDNAVALRPRIVRAGRAVPVGRRVVTVELLLLGAAAAGRHGCTGAFFLPRVPRRG